MKTRAVLMILALAILTALALPGIALAGKQVPQVTSVSVYKYDGATSLLGAAFTFEAKQAYAWDAVIQEALYSNTQYSQVFTLTRAQKKAGSVSLTTVYGYTPTEYTPALVTVRLLDRNGEVMTFYQVGSGGFQPWPAG